MSKNSSHPHWSKFRYKEFNYFSECVAFALPSQFFLFFIFFLQLQDTNVGT